MSQFVSAENSGSPGARRPSRTGILVKKRTVTLLVALLSAHVAFAQENALPALREAAKRAPSDPAAQFALGRGLIEAGRLPEAETAMNAGVRLSKESIESLYEAARVKFASGDYKRSRAACALLAKKDKDHVLTHVCMARAFLVWRRSSRAVESIDRALALDPNNAEALLADADAKRIQGDFAGAEKAYAALLARAPRNADAYVGLALSRSASNQPKEAVDALRQAAAISPDDPDVQYELGQRVSGAEAVSLLTRATAGRPRWADAEFALATAKLNAGDAAGAEPGLAAYLKLHPASGVAMAHRGAALVALGRYADAEPVLRKALELIPNDYETSLSLARLYERTNRYEDAFTQYRNAADLKRESTEPLLAAARLGLQLNRPVLASALLDKALERTPKSAELLGLYGDVQAARGDAKVARDYYQRALAAEGPVDRAAIEKRLRELK
jgi:tetratricopeptide (TPR) repeat protein